VKYRVVISATAKENLREGYQWAAKHAPETAARWLSRFQAALQTLSTSPERCSIAPETELVQRQIRQFLFGRHRSIWRALFVIQGSEVHVLHVRRASMDTATPDQLGGLE
jgi:plasmid stabilization system protein ParE